MIKKISIAILVMAVAGAAIYYFTRGGEPAVTQQVEQVQQATNDLPYLKFTKLDGAVVSAHDLPGKTILVMFNSDCDHCQREAGEISEKISLFKDYTLYFLASDPIENILKFAQEYGLASHKNVIFGRAEVPDVIQTFGPIATPSVYIYSQEKRLVKYFNGETKVADIVSFL